MKQINLKSGGPAQAAQAAMARSKKQKKANSIMVGLSILVLTASLYGGLAFYKAKVVRERERIEAEMLSRKKRLDSSDFKELYDFYDRLLELKSVSSNKTLLSDTLEKISQSTMDEIQFQDLSFEIVRNVARVDATVLTRDYETLSKQLEAYSQIEGADSVTLDQSEQGQEALEAIISFSILESTKGD